MLLCRLAEKVLAVYCAGIPVIQHLLSLDRFFFPRFHFSIACSYGNLPKTVRSVEQDHKLPDYSHTDVDLWYKQEK